MIEILECLKRGRYRSPIHPQFFPYSIIQGLSFLLFKVSVIKKAESKEGSLKYRSKMNEKVQRNERYLPLDAKVDTDFRLRKGRMVDSKRSSINQTHLPPAEHGTEY